MCGCWSSCRPTPIAPTSSSRGWSGSPPRRRSTASAGSRSRACCGASRARLDSTAAGFPLQVYVLVTLARHDEVANRRFEEAVLAIPHVIAADWVTGEVDAVLMVVARDVAELQHVLNRLSTRGASRLVTLLRLEELKPSSPLPLDRARDLDSCGFTGTFTGTDEPAHDRPRHARHRRRGRRRVAHDGLERLQPARPALARAARPRARGRPRARLLRPRPGRQHAVARQDGLGRARARLPADDRVHRPGHGPVPARRRRRLRGAGARPVARAAHRGRRRRARAEGAGRRLRPLLRAGGGPADGRRPRPQAPVRARRLRPRARPARRQHRRRGRRARHRRAPGRARPPAVRDRAAARPARRRPAPRPRRARATTSRARGSPAGAPGSRPPASTGAACPWPAGPASCATAAASRAPACSIAPTARPRSSRSRTCSPSACSTPPPSAASPSPASCRSPASTTCPRPRRAVPPLTTVRQPHNRKGSEAVRLLLEPDCRIRRPPHRARRPSLHRSRSLKGDLPMDSHPIAAPDGHRVHAPRAHRAAQPRRGPAPPRRTAARVLQRRRTALDPCVSPGRRTLGR